MPRDENPDRDAEAQGLDAEFPTLTEGPEAATEVFGAGEDGLAVGRNLGGRYQVVGRLGAGGMGEVWRAFDLKLRVEVALKALREDLFRDEKRLEMLRQEVRAAREVVSPNVCRIFDLVEVDGRELVSMEYVDGQTLLQVLQERGPLELKEAQDIASQFLAGLEAIHKAGLVHRDVKPENIMLTRAGRVVLMDFGLARGEDSGAGTVAGTPAYMAPEQAAGMKVDARADVYSAGVVLAEMVSPEGIKSLQSRKSVWEGVRSEPAKLPDSPWAPVLKKAVAKEPEQRYHSAHTLTRALEEVTLRVEGAEDLHPYPGLASFTEEDAEYFFGREAEIETTWRRLDGAHLLAIVGPSGAGKTSFIAAGLVPNAAADWAIVRCTPGNSAIPSLARVMAREMAGDADAMELAVGFDDPDVAVELFTRWRRRHDQALLIVDQFEEVFTLNPVEVQRRFAGLLGRLVIEANVRVLLSMRDDFLMQCKLHDPLLPLFESLIPLMPPTGPALRRAVVQPAMKCGYRFEDDQLVDEMLAEVEGERGALPLLAFAMARLWEKRDRENGLLTRRAHHDIGGVGGALARHAEETVDRIGSDRVPIVRELFRNLVTAEGTRAVREWDELLSVFDEPQREIADQVLRELIDARLLTSYEVQEEGRESTRRVEIIHESLLAAWPRLVRWRTQDQEGAQLRDELRQAARSWDEHERPEDRLWTGTAFREFQVWRERYPGGLTEVEEAFAEAMTSLATRRRRRRRMVAAAGVLLFASIAAVFAGLWRRSVSETRRAAGAELVALGQLELESYPSATVAHAIASLELADSPAARRLALEALWKGPTALIVNENDSWTAEFTPDGDWIVQSVGGTGALHLIGKDGDSTMLHPPEDWFRTNILVNPTGEILYSERFATRRSRQHLVLWSIPDGRQLADAQYEAPAYLANYVWQEARVLVLVEEGDLWSIDAVSFDGTIERLGSPDFALDAVGWLRQTAMDVETGRWIGAIDNGDVCVVEIEDHGLSEPRVLGRHDGTGLRIAFHPRGSVLATSDDGGTMRLWDPSGASPPRAVQGPPGITGLGFPPDGPVLAAITHDEERVVMWAWSVAPESPTFLRKIDLGPVGRGGYWMDATGMRVARSGLDRGVRLSSLSSPADAEPLLLLRGDLGVQYMPRFHPSGEFLVSMDTSGLTLWPLRRTFPAVIRRHEAAVRSVVFEPEGRWLASGGLDETVRIWPLAGDVPPTGRVAFEGGNDINGLAVAPDSTWLLVGCRRHLPAVVPLDGQPSMTLEGFLHSPGVAVSADGQLAAVLGTNRDDNPGAIVIWKDGAWDQPALFELGDQLDFGGPYGNPYILRNHEIITADDSGLRRVHPATGEHALIHPGAVGQFAVTEDELWVALVELSEFSFGASGHAVVRDLETDTVKPLENHGENVWAIALDATGTVVATGDKAGMIRVGPTTGEEPHLLLGHEGRVWSVAIDPLGRWIASGGEDGTVRLWPMPDLSKPPLHTLPREELIAKLRTLTNLRVVRDDESATGWKLTHDPFPGWETVPTW